MTKVIITTHGPLADALKECSRMFFGDKSDELYTIGLFPEDSPTDLFNRLKYIIKTDEQDDYLILVDIFGGTPFNTVALLMEDYSNVNIQCLTGVNMPLIMEILSAYDSVPLTDLMSSLENVATDSIINLRKALDF